jgi:haloalkane dehalogenase
MSLYLRGHDHSIAVAGDGPPIVLVHGSATHGYAWRNLIPYLARGHRCLAPDLPGMGRSDGGTLALRASFTFDEQLSNLRALIQLLEPKRSIVLIGHELGAMLAAQYARENEGSVAGLVFIEGSFRVSNDMKFPPDIQDFFSRVRVEDGETAILDDNMLIEFYLKRLTSRHLGPEEMRGYRDPYQKRRSRHAMLSMIRQLPLRSYPGPIDDLAEEVRRWCAGSPIPKLVIGGFPGFLVPQPVLATTGRWANTRTALVPGRHFLLEDSPATITSTVLDWLRRIGHVLEPPAPVGEQGTEQSSSDAGGDASVDVVVDVDDPLPNQSL